MLTAARAQGMPIMVIVMITAAMSQATAIHKPPVNTQMIFKIRFSSDMCALSSGAFQDGLWCLVHGQALSTLDRLHGTRHIQAQGGVGPAKVGGDGVERRWPAPPGRR